MAKSNRRRKQDRAKRQARDSQKQTATRRRQEWQQEVDAAAERLRLLSDPEAPLGEMTDLLNIVHGPGPVPAYLVDRMRELGWSMERLAELADMILVPDDGGEGEPSLTALTFAAQVDHELGNQARVSELLNQALAIAEESGEPIYRLRLTNNLRAIGRLPEAVALLEASLREDPDDGYANELYGTAISEAYERGERAVLDRFTDRSGLTDLSDAVSGFLSGSEYGRVVDNEVKRHLGAVEEVRFNPADLDSFRAIVAENALLSTRLERHGEQGETEPLTVIGAFAADPSTPPELAARARAWDEHFHHGLWMVDAEPAPPGLWCTDICTGEMRYVEFPAHVTEGWPRWSTWLGGIVPVDGIWRATGLGLRLSPAEADAAAEFVDEAVFDLVDEIVGKKKQAKSWQPDDAMRIGAAEPYGVLAEDQDPMPPLMASIARGTMDELVWRIFLEVHLDRRAYPLRGSALVGAGHEKAWLDEPQAALHGRTPWESAESDDRPRLESMLRQFEYEADELAAQGQSGIDVEWLREELDMPALSLDD